jgi:hypothetical protein
LGGIDAYTKVLADAVEYIKRLYSAVGELKRIAADIRPAQRGPGQH